MNFTAQEIADSNNAQEVSEFIKQVPELMVNFVFHSCISLYLSRYNYNFHKALSLLIWFQKSPKNLDNVTPVRL